MISHTQHTLRSIQKGFTLIEMLLAISIFALVITSITPAFFTMQDKIGLDNKAKEIGAVLFETRTKSLQGAGDTIKSIVMTKGNGIHVLEIPRSNNTTYESLQKSPSSILAFIGNTNNLLHDQVGDETNTQTPPYFQIDNISVQSSQTTQPSSIIILYEPISSNTSIFADNILLSSSIDSIDLTLSSVARPFIKKTANINPMTGISQ